MAGGGTYTYFTGRYSSRDGIFRGELVLNPHSPLPSNHVYSSFHCGGRAVSPKGVSDADAHINFGAPAVLQKAPSMDKQRSSSAGPYTVVHDTLDECIRQFTSNPS